MECNTINIELRIIGIFILSQRHKVLQTILGFTEKVSQHDEGNRRRGEGPDCEAGRCQHSLPLHLQALHYHVW